jgi:beta-glucanase (GH16 family)
VGKAPVKDAQGRTWTPATGISGGTTVSQYGGIGDTASEGLYKTAQVGILSWTITVPQPGRYAIDLLTADAQNTAVGARVFDVVADTGTQSVSLVKSLDIVGLVKGYHPEHVTGVVTVSGTVLRLRFSAVRGMPLVTALAVTAYGSQASVTTFNDTFDGPSGSTANAGAWSYDVGTGFETGSVQTYTKNSSTGSLDGNGHLAVTARRDLTGRWTSARLTSKGKFAFTYGTVEVHAQVPSGQGLLPAIWSLGTSIDSVGWPGSGEMDLMEHLGNQPTQVSGHIHALGDLQDALGYKNQRISNIGLDWNSGLNVSQDFHTYSMDVQPDAVTFRFDGKAYFTAAREDMRGGQAWTFGQPFYILMQITVGGPWQGQPDASTPAVNSMLIDQVIVRS